VEKKIKNKKPNTVNRTRKLGLNKIRKKGAGPSNHVVAGTVDKYDLIGTVTITTKHGGGGGGGDLWIFRRSYYL
jgi:hypothetical protein